MTDGVSCASGVSGSSSCGSEVTNDGKSELVGNPGGCCRLLFPGRTLAFESALRATLESRGDADQASGAGTSSEGLRAEFPFFVDRCHGLCLLAGVPARPADTPPRT